MDKLEEDIFFRSEKVPDQEFLRARRGLLENEEERDLVLGYQGRVRFPVWIQFSMLGLYDLHKRLEGKKVLDIGCGDNADLVYWLRAHGVDAEGLDPRARDEPHFMKKTIRLGEGIPRGDNHYDLVLMNSVPTFTSMDDNSNNADYILRLNYLVSETLRVLKPRCEFRVAPRIPTEGYTLMQTIRGYNGSAREENMTNEEGAPSLFTRTVITKGKK